MGEGEYAGDTLSKKRARQMFWTLALTLLDEESPDGRLLVLASREMGDYGTLSAFGCLPSDVVAVDTDEEAVRYAKEKYPEADVRHGEAGKVTEQLGYDEELAGAFLDFCSPICPELLDTCTRVLKNVAVGGIFGVGLLKGREKDGKTRPERAEDYGNRKMRRIAKSRGAREKFNQANPSLSPASDNPALAHVNDVHHGVADLNARKLNALMRDQLQEDDLGTVRATTLITLMMGRARGRSLQLCAIINYQSSREGSKGVPMTYVLFKVIPEPKLIRSGRNQMTIGYVEPVRKGCRYFNVKADENWLREEALRVEAAGLDASRMLNIPATKVGAWKAHATRGTYAHSAEEINVPTHEAVR